VDVRLASPAAAPIRSINEASQLAQAHEDARDETVNVTTRHASCGPLLIAVEETQCARERRVVVRDLIGHIL
jgi:hypothetical protein